MGMATQELPKTGEAVRTVMYAKRVSQRELGDALGKSQAYISRRLAGDVDFSVNDLTAVAAILDTPIVDLLPSPGNAPVSTSPEVVEAGALPGEGSMITLEALKIIASPMTDDEIYDGLDPVLRAYLEERVEATPELRETLAVAALGRVLGWAED
jgi:transcriptional regulator with XRE-family HTH domain